MSDVRQFCLLLLLILAIVQQHSIIMRLQEIKKEAACQKEVRNE